MIGRKTPTRFTITPGEPWLINGSATEATSPQEALHEIYAAAKRFPVIVEVEQGSEPSFYLEMDSSGRTTPIQDPAAEQTEEAAPSAPAQEADHEDQTPDTTPEPAEETGGSAAVEKPRRLTPLAWGLFALAVLLVGALAAVALFFGHEEAPETAASSAPAETASASTTQGWQIPEGQRALTVFHDQVATVEGSTLRILNADTGEQIGEPVQVQDPQKVRYLSGATAGAVDTGAGQVILTQGTQNKTYPGSLNARGTEPVVVSSDTYRTAAGEVHAIGTGQAVLAGTAKDTVLVQGSDKVTAGKRTTTLKAPTPGAKITQWVGASDDRTIVEWSKDSKHWLVSHDTASGAVKMQKEIAGKKISVRAGKIWVGTEQYLEGDQLQNLCTGGTQVDSSIICPEGDHWVTADHKRAFDHRPEAISTTYAVSDGTVIPTRGEK